MRDHVTKNLLSVVVELAERIELLEAQLEAAAFVQHNLDAMTGKCADLETQNDRLHRDYAALLLRFEEEQAKAAFVRTNLDAKVQECGALGEQNEKLRVDYLELMQVLQEQREKVSELTQELLKRDEE